MKYLMPMMCILCAACLSAQSLSGNSSGARLSPLNPPTVAADDEYKVFNGQTLVVAAPGVLANDRGLNLIPVPYAPEDPADPYAPLGVLMLYKDGGFEYTPPAGFEGVDEFIYILIGANGETSKARLRLWCMTLPPACAADEYKVFNGETLEVGAPGVLANDWGDELVAMLTENPQDGTGGQGTLMLNLDGSFSYTPLPGFEGIDEFWYLAVDSSGHSAPGVIRFYCINDGTQILAAQPLMNETRGEPKAAGCAAGEGAGAWLLLPLLGLALLRLRRARA